MADLKQVRRDETRLRILTKADEMFRQFGFMRTTVADVAAELQMSTANIYKYFPSKEAIIEASATKALDLMTSQILLVANSKETASSRIQQIVLIIVRRQLHTFHNEKQFYRLIIMSIESGWTAPRRFRENLNAIMDKLILGGITTGEFKKGQHSKAGEILMDCLLCVTHPLLLREIADTDVEKKAIVQVEFILRALK
ncbi:MAG: TetR/AcrR family transcriptional regulator [Pseudomonadota bacterium]|nr:TetR/AcrR family transcriptional regulator [Pseudomonadota bacterium]